jgi:hypothetical protein
MLGDRLLLGVGHRPCGHAARARQTGRNFVFFDAPVGLIFAIHAALTKHSEFDARRTGPWLGNVSTSFVRAFSVRQLTKVLHPPLAVRA